LKFTFQERKSWSYQPSNVFILVKRKTRGTHPCQNCIHKGNIPYTVNLPNFPSLTFISVLILASKITTYVNFHPISEPAWCKPLVFPVCLGLSVERAYSNFVGKTWILFYVSASFVFLFYRSYLMNPLASVIRV